MGDVRLHIVNPKAIEQTYPHVCLTKLGPFDGPKFFVINNYTMLKCGYCGARFDLRALNFRRNPIWSNPNATEQRRSDLEPADRGGSDHHSKLEPSMIMSQPDESELYMGPYEVSIFDEKVQMDLIVNAPTNSTGMNALLKHMCDMNQYARGIFMRELNDRGQATRLSQPTDEHHYSIRAWRVLTDDGKPW